MKSKLKIIVFFSKEFPQRAFLLLFLLLLAGVVESFGIATLYPLLQSILNEGIRPDNAVNRAVLAIFSLLDLAPTPLSVLLLFTAGMVGKTLIQYAAARQVASTTALAGTHLRLRMLDAIFRSDWDYFTRQSIGGIANSISMEAGAAAGTFHNAVTLLTLLVQAVIFLVVGLAVSWQITLAGMLLAPMVALLFGYWVRQSRQAGERSVVATKTLVETLIDLLQGAKSIKSMACEPFVHPLLAREVGNIQEACTTQVLAVEKVRLSGELAMALLVAVSLVFSVAFLHMDISVVIMMGFVFQRLLSNVFSIQRQYQFINTLEAAFWSFHASYQKACDHEEVAGEEREMGTIQEGIVFQDVSFAYGEKRILGDFSLRLPARGLIVLVGPSGAGKTTLIDLVVGLRTPESGRILIDGIPLGALARRSWRRKIGYVPQEIFLFNGSVFDNVTMADPSVTREKVREALRMAEANDFVSALARDMDTNIGERGSLISGGQRQRISLARAIAREPSILILDEVTASLDPETEARIGETVKALSRRFLILAVTHQHGLRGLADQVIHLPGPPQSASTR